MVSNAKGETLLCELKAIDGAYPLVWRILELSTSGPITSILTEQSVVVGPLFLSRLSLFERRRQSVAKRKNLLQDCRTGFRRARSNEHWNERWSSYIHAFFLVSIVVDWRRLGPEYQKKSSTKPRMSQLLKSDWRCFKLSIPIYGYKVEVEAIPEQNEVCPIQRAFIHCRTFCLFSSVSWGLHKAFWSGWDKERPR